MTSVLPLSSIIQFLTTAAALSVVAMLWKNRKASEVIFLILIEVNVATWAFFYASEFSTPVLQSKIIWSQMSYLGITFLPVNFLFFILAFSKYNRFINLRNYLLTSIIPIATIVMVITNPRHHLIWETISLPPGSNIMYYDHGPWFWFYWGYAFFLIVLGLLILISHYFRLNRIYRPHIAILLMASLIPIVGNLAYITGINPYAGFDWTTTCFVVTGLIITIGVYRHHMFEIVPLATRELIRILKDGVIILNNRGLIEDFNPVIRQIFHMNGSPVLKASYRDVFKNHDDFVTLIEQNTDDILDFQVKKQNDTRYYLVKTLPIQNKRKQFSGKLILLNDVTSIRKSEVKLKDKNKQLLNEIERNATLIDDLDAFSHTVAHDLKNLLGAIFTTSETMNNLVEAQDFKTIKEFSLLIKDSALKSIHVTDELLKLATADSKDVKIAPIDMQFVFQQAKDQLKDKITEKDARIEIIGNWLNVNAYAPWLIEVWVNYLSNAIKYGGNPPEIKVGCDEMNNGKIKYWIQDNGDGISQEHHANLFEKHSRFHQGKALGYGLGLSIAKRIIEKMNGTVGVESTGETGQGARFYFTLPGN